MPASKAVVSATDRAKASQKLTPERSMAGNARNIGIDGRKNQKADWASSATRSPSPVSRHSQTKVSSDTNGSETISPPIPGHRRATSEATAMTTPEIAALMRR